MSKLFPPHVISFFEANNAGKSAKEMTELLNAKFGTHYTCEQIKACRARHHWNSGLTGRFEKGSVPYNKGKKTGSYPGMERTQFKAGNRPLNYRPVGSERVNVDGYHERKVADPNRWRPIHIIEWEKLYGPVPEGHALVFRDGDKDNTSVENLMLVSRRELAVMNKRGLRDSSSASAEACRTLARYIMAVSEKKREVKKRKHHAPSL